MSDSRVTLAIDRRCSYRRAKSVAANNRRPAKTEENAPTVCSASLQERRGLEPPVLFGLFHLGKKGRSQAAFGPNLLADRSEKQFSDRL